MIELDRVSFHYPPVASGGEGLVVLDALSLRIQQGERVALLGATGAGKTTLLLILAGLVPSITGGTLQGRVMVAGHDVRSVEPGRLSEEVGLLFQQAEHQLFNMSVEEEIAFGLEGMGLPVPEIEDRIEWALERVGLQGQRERAPWQLSGGEQKRLALGTVLATRPRLLLLDEPMAGLDPAGRWRIATLLEELKGQRESTILVTEQDTEWVARWADRVLVLHDGQIVLDGPTREVLSQVDTLHALAVQPPQIAEVDAALHLPGRPLRVCEAAPLLQQMVGGEGMGEAERTREPVARSAAPPAIAARNLYFHYGTGRPALTGLSLEVPEGQFVAIVGPNGGGKTTFAKHLNGLLRPHQGELRLFGQPTAQRPVGELARQVGYLFQNPDLQIFQVSVREELAFGPRNLGLGEREVQGRVEEALERFDLQRWADVPPAVLGYGQRRMVTVAALWTMQPRIWVLDEPTTGLDGWLTQRVVEAMQALHSAGHTLLLITHDPRLAALAERVAVISGGRIAYDGPTHALMADPATLQRFGLEPPAVTRLAQRVAGVPDDLLTVEELVAAVRHAHAL